MAKYNTVTHLLFDLDGLLIDTETIYKSVHTKVAQKYGKVYSDEVRLKVMGTKEQDTARIMVEQLGLPIKAEEFIKECSEHMKEAMRNVSMMPGAEKIIRHFHAKGVPMCVATSSSKESCAIKLAKFTELFSLFHHIVQGSSDSEVVNGKPAPDIFLIAAKRFPDPPPPEKCLVFEDSYNGAVAGRAAGMQVVMVPDILVSEENRKVATIVLDSLENFKPQLFGLPPLDS